MVVKLRPLNLFQDDWMFNACIVGKKFLIQNLLKDLGPKSKEGNFNGVFSTKSSSMSRKDAEYIDNNDIAAIDSIERRTCSKLNISDHVETTGNVCKREILMEMGSKDKIVDLDIDFMDPQMTHVLY